MFFIQNVTEEELEITVSGTEITGTKTLNLYTNIWNGYTAVKLPPAGAMLECVPGCEFGAEWVTVATMETISFIGIQRSKIGPQELELKHSEAALSVGEVPAMGVLPERATKQHNLSGLVGVLCSCRFRTPRGLFQ